MKKKVAKLLCRIKTVFIFAMITEMKSRKQQNNTIDVW